MHVINANQAPRSQQQLLFLKALERDLGDEQAAGARLDAKLVLHKLIESLCRCGVAD